MSKETTVNWNGYEIGVRKHSQSATVVTPPYTTDIKIPYIDEDNKTQLYTSTSVHRSWSFTCRDLEILYHQSLGKTQEEVAQDLDISASTVHNNIAKLRKRNDMASSDDTQFLATAEAIQTAIHFELIYPISIIGLKALTEDI